MLQQSAVTPFACPTFSLIDNDRIELHPVGLQLNVEEIEASADAATVRLFDEAPGLDFGGTAIFDFLRLQQDLLHPLEQ